MGSFTVCGTRSAAADVAVRSGAAEIVAGGRIVAGGKEAVATVSIALSGREVLVPAACEVDCNSEVMGVLLSRNATSRAQPTVPDRLIGAVVTAARV
jgi:hypothetical protein